MTLILETTPEIEAEIERAARDSGQSVPEWVLAAIRERAARAKIWSDLKGSLAGKLGSVDEFLTEKHAEVERENAREDARGL